MLSAILKFLKDIPVHMLSAILNFLKDIPGSLGNAAFWVWKHMIPKFVKEKVKDVMPTSFPKMVVFVFKIFLDIYFYMVVISIIVVYYLFKALKDTGILKKFWDILEDAVGDVLYISQHCFPVIDHLDTFLRCVGIK